MEILISAIVALLAIISTLLFRSFIGRYIETKTTNLATKEDIGEITEIVETIKADLMLKTEELKAQLSFSNQHRLNLKNVEREAYFDYNKKMAAWFYYLARLDISQFKLENYEEINNERKEIAKRSYELDLADAQLNLFMQNKPFIDAQVKLKSSVNKLEDAVLRSITKTYYINSIWSPQYSSALPGQKVNVFQAYNQEYSAHLFAAMQEVHNHNMIVQKNHIELAELISDKITILSEEII